MTAPAASEARAAVPLRPPEVLVIGAMKCATSAVHEYLDAHPLVTMSEPKELNFFNGPEEPPDDDEGTWWQTGQWHRGPTWYLAQFDPEARVRGESSPGYTSPSFPEVPARMAALAPSACLVYLVRDPFERAASQYAHHRRDGSERRPMAEALLDEASQYLDRSRYHERLEPFLRQFPSDQICVVVQERLLRHRSEEVAALHRHVGLEPHWDPVVHGRRHHVGTREESTDSSLRARFLDRVRADVDRLRALLDDDVSEWRV